MKDMAVFSLRVATSVAIGVVQPFGAAIHGNDISSPSSLRQAFSSGGAARALRYSGRKGPARFRFCCQSREIQANLFSYLSVFDNGCTV